MLKQGHHNEARTFFICCEFAVGSLEFLCSVYNSSTLLFLGFEQKSAREKRTRKSVPNPPNKEKHLSYSREFLHALLIRKST